MRRLYCFDFLALFITFLSLVWTSSHANGYLNKHLVLTAIKNPLAKDPNSTTVHAGIVEEILLDILAEKLNFTYSIHPPTDMLSGGILLRNGSWTGSTGQLQRKEADMLVTTTAPTLMRRQVLDISFPVFFVDTAILIPFPKEEDNTDILLEVFQPTASIGAIVVFGFIILSAWIIHRATNPNQYDHSQDQLNFWAFYFISVFSSQGLTLRNKSSSFRLVWGVSFLGIFIICNYYTAAYTSLVLIPTFDPIINSIEELANSETVNAHLVKGSTTEEYILLSTDPVLRKIGDQMRRFPTRRITDTYTVSDISTIVNGNNVLIIIKPTADSLIQQSFMRDRKCRVTVAEKTFYSRGQSYTYQKNSFLTDIFDKKILLMQQFGLTTYADKRAASLSHNPCYISEIKAAQSSEVVLLTSKEMAGAFLLFGVGICMAGLAFAIELLTKKIKTN